MQLPALLFAALAAFLIGSVSADTRPIAVPPSCSGTGQYNTGCFCTGGCGSGAQAWFSCYNAAGSKPLQDIGIRFEAGYSQPSQTRSWQISNQVGWPSGISVDQFEPNVIRGSDPSLPGPTPTVPSNTDQWYTSGVVPLNTANPTGPTMWACTKNGLLQRSSNGGFGPIQPRCYSIATGVYTAPYSQGCQESNLFDAPNSAGLQYRGWAFAGIKVKALDGSVPTPLDPGNTIIPSTPLGATELRPLPQNYAAGGVTMNCFVSLFNPCSTVVSTCPANTICVGSAAPSGNTVATCPVANCCPASSVIRPTDGSAWYCCPSGQVAVTSGTTTKCCPTGSGLDNNLNCCPNAQIVSGTRVCCPTANFDPSKPNTCCPFTVVGTTCCPVDPATVYTGTPAIPSNQNFLSGSPAVCCPTANVNDQPSTSNVACCPTTTGGNKFVDKDLSGSGQASTRFCCPTTQFITSGVTRICCPATGGPFTFTTNGQEKCCPTSQLSKCSGSPFCCPNGNPTTCVGVPADGADFFPCCPTTDVRTVSDTAGASAPRCCPGTSTTLTYVYFAGQGCCLATYVVDLTAQSGSGFTGSANGAANNKFCCPGGFGATSGPSTAVAFACSAVTSTLCTWNANSACCPTNRIASVGAVAGNRGNTLCCPSAGPFATCNSFTDCPRNPSGSNVDQINPCCPASATIVLCGTDKYCCPSGGGLECKSAGASNRRCCPTANVPLQNNVTPQDYCCPGNPGTNPFIYVDATNPCCPINRIPFLPGTTTRSYTLCCPNDGQQYVVVNSQCCLQSAAVFDTANNVWLCCPNIGSNPQVVNGNCCPRSATFNTNYCCPQFNGRSIPTGALFCPTAPTTRTDCWVNNANCQRIGGPATGCCCFAGSLTRQATNGPAVPDPAICCDAGQGLGFNNAGFFFTNQDPCCPTSRLVSTFRTTPTSADSAYCCPTTVSALPAQPIGGVTCSYYTPLPDKNGNTQTCCRNCDVSRNLAGATSTDPNARCCDNAAQIPTIVDVVASGTSSSYTRFCCPASFVFQYQGTSYCCPASIAQVPISKVINNVCCPPNQDVAIPGGSTLVCCPNYDSTKGIPVWTDLGTGGSGNCCPPNQALTFSGSGLPNVPASNATGAPTSAAPHRFCCPANQLPSGVPAPDAYIPALDAVSGSVNFNTNYNNLRCCPAANVLRVQAPNGKVYDVCCPNPNMIFNKDTGLCCPQGVIAPPCPVPYPLVGCSGSCCPPGQTGAIGTSGNPPLPTGSTQSCCPTGQIRTFLGVGYCCPSNVLPTTTGAFYNNDPTKIRPCCPVVDQLTCPASNAGCNATTAPYQLCCPAGDFPIPANVAGNTPPPSLIVDPQTGKCCRGYLNSASGPRPGGNRCCVPKAGITVYFQAADDPCCTTLVDPTDGTCCPLASYRVNAQGQALCCPANTVWATNDLKCCPIALATGRQPDGTYTDCCDDPLYTNDPGQTCCLTTTLQNGYCCPPTQLDDFGRCCLNNTTPLNKFIDTSSGVPVVVLNKSVCCDSGLKDCAGFCYFLDPADDVVKAYHVQGANNTGCCPSSSLDCAGQCPSNCANGVCTGPARNNGTITDCCPDSKRGCLNGVPNAGACGAADTNCCAQLSGRNCTACTTTPGCGWCNAIGSASGLCLSGDYFGPNAGVEGIVCNQTGGFRWTAVGESKIFQSINGFGDGRNIEYANVSVLLAKNVPIVVPFRIKAPNDLPLDLYILQDRTNSFIQPVVIPSTTPPTYIQYGALDVLKGNLDGLDAAISALVPSGYHLGFGTFGDKAVEPFGFWANSGFFDFVFQNVYPISANRAATIAAIKALDPNTFAGGNDIPEASIEALLHVAQNPVINWGTVRANSLGKNVPVNKIAIVVTDAPAHTASTNWAAYAPGVRFPNTDFPNAAPGAAQDLSFYLTPATQPSKRVALNPVDSWKAHSGVYTDTDCLASDPSTARIRQPVTAFDPARQGICTDYPSASQVATAIGVTGFTSVFAVAETVSALYPLSAGYDFWSNFSVTDLPAAGATPGLTVKLDFTKDPNAPGGLVYTIREAIKNITQSITFENTTSSQFMNTISSSFTLPPDGIQTVNVPLFWDGTDYGSTGPFPIDFQAIFPLSGYVIDVARINVYISPEKRCCFCGDGVVQNETGCDEECDNDGATDSVCCKACKIDVGQICSNDNLCVPVICEKDGKCTPKNINDECVNDVLDPFAFCQFNTCIAGSCIVTCSSDACCNDSDPCTQDSCNDLSLCQYTLLPECDCSNQAFNNCFDCVRNNNTKCAYEANSGTCFQFNETIYEQGGYGGSEINPVTDEKGISRYCIVVRPPGSKTGVIVGAVVGTLAALGLIALAAALWWRLRNGPILAPGGTANTAGAAGAAQANPTYVQPSTQTNPLHDNGGGGN